MNVRSGYFRFYHQWIEDGLLARLQPGALRVLLALLSHADGEGVAWPGLPRLSALSGLSPRQVSRALRELEQMRLLMRAVRGRKPVYYLCTDQRLPAALEGATTTAPPPSVPPSANATDDTHVMEKDDTGVREGGHSASPKDDTHVIQTKPIEEEPGTRALAALGSEQNHRPPQPGASPQPTPPPHPPAHSPAPARANPSIATQTPAAFRPTRPPASASARPRPAFTDRYRPEPAYHRELRAQRIEAERRQRLLDRARARSSQGQVAAVLADVDDARLAELAARALEQAPEPLRKTLARSDPRRSPVLSSLIAQILTRKPQPEPAA